MPSCITHQLIAEEAKTAFPPEVREAAEKHYDYFFLGAQGPDCLFFLKPLSKKEFNLGRYLHRNDVFAVFLFFKKYVKSLADEELERVTAFVAGYVSHYSADTVFHPFVYAYLQAHKTRGMIHQLIETDWDVYFARVNGRNPVGWKFPLSPKKINREGTLYRLFAALSEELGRLPLDKKAFDKGMKNFARYLRFFHNKFLAKLLSRTEQLLHIKPRLSCIYPREQPHAEFLCGEEFVSLAGGRGRDADELFDLAVSESVRLNNAFFSEDPLPRQEFNKSFLSAENLS